MKKTILLIFFISIIPFVFADLSDEFSNKVTVVFPADAKPDLLVAGGHITAYVTQDPTRKITTLLDDEVEETTGDFVFIGGPCQNKAVQQVVSITDCALDEGYGKTVLKVIKKDKQTVLILAGTNDKEMRQVAEELRYGKITLQDNKYVTGKEIMLPKKTNETVKPIVASNETKCQGCFLKGKCLQQWELGSDAGKAVYCKDSKLIPQQENGQSCINNIDCVSGRCEENSCVTPKKYAGLIGGIIGTIIGLLLVIWIVKIVVKRKKEW